MGIYRMVRGIKGHYSFKVAMITLGMAADVDMRASNV
jgi:hypothetical protein